MRRYWRSNGGAGSSPSTDERGSLAQPSQSSSPFECTSHLGFSLDGLVQLDMGNWVVPSGPRHHPISHLIGERESFAGPVVGQLAELGLNVPIVPVGLANPGVAMDDGDQRLPPAYHIRIDKASILSAIVLYAISLNISPCFITDGRPILLREVAKSLVAPHHHRWCIPHLLCLPHASTLFQRQGGRRAG